MTSPRLLVISSCTGLKAVKAPALTLDDFVDHDHLVRREHELAWVRRPAAAMYTGWQHVYLMRGLDRLRRAFGDDFADLRILSAGYGLIQSDRAICPYDVTFNDMGKAQARAWARHLGVPGNVRAGARLLGDCSKATGWPTHGVYFFFEPGEQREAGEPRVVRVGTHAVSAGSKTTLWNRLSTHRGAVGGSQAGGGNHRGSIFRLHVGKALLARGAFDEQATATWGVGASAPKAVRQAEYPIELAVSRYLRTMTVLCVSVPGDAGMNSDRKVIEANAIALLSNRRREPIDPPSTGWLGRLSQHPAVRESGLWNVQHVDEHYDPAFLNVLEGYMRSTGT